MSCGQCVAFLTTATTRAFWLKEWKSKVFFLPLVFVLDFLLALTFILVVALIKLVVARGAISIDDRFRELISLKWALTFKCPNALPHLPWSLFVRWKHDANFSSQSEFVIATHSSMCSSWSWSSFFISVSPPKCDSSASRTTLNSLAQSSRLSPFRWTHWNQSLSAPTATAISWRQSSQLK